MLGAVIVFRKINGFFLKIGQQRVRQLGHPDLGVSHRCSRVAIDGAEITLAVDERITKRECLRHTNDGVVNRRITVRVVLTNHVTNDASGLFIRLVPVVVQLVHCKQDTAVNGFQTISDIGQCAPDNNAHRIIHVGLLELVLDIYGEYFLR